MHKYVNTATENINSFVMYEVFCERNTRRLKQIERHQNIRRTAVAKL